MGILIAVDGGKSGTRVRCRLDGTERDAELAGFTHGRGVDAAVGFTRLVRDLRETVAACVGDLPPAERPVEGVCLGLTSLPGRPSDRRALAAAVANALGAGRVVLTGDAVPAHVAGVGGPGVLASVGTGTMVLALSASGWTQVDGWGPLLGDRGSGIDLGMTGARAALAGVDGSGATTALTAALHRLLGGFELDALQRFMGDPRHLDVLAGFGREVSDTAAAGDQVARGLCAAAAAELAGSIRAAITRSGLPPDCRVALSGRMALSEPVRSALAGQLRRPELAAEAPADALAGGLALAHEVPEEYAPMVEEFHLPASATPMARR